jgi:phosphate transport system permease protein
MTSPFGQTPLATAPEPRGKPRLSFFARYSHVGDSLFRGLCWLSGALVLVLAALLVVFLVWQALPAMRHYGFRFLLNTNQGSDEEMGALPFIYGTVVTSAIAMLLAVPLGVGSAAFLAEIAPGWLRRTGSFLVELLAAIPSVVYGFWGIYVLAPAVQKLFDLWPDAPNTSGDGLLAAGLILAIMIVPYVTAISYDVCRAVPRSQREGALALGATRWQTIWTVVLPYARPGIVGGCFLALGRALGETMAVVMLIGNNLKFDEYSFTPFGTGATIPSVIALELNDSPALRKSALIELGLILLVVSVLVNCLARLLIWRVGRVGKKTSWWRRLLGSGQNKPGPAPAAVAEVGLASPPEPPAPASTGKARWTNRLMTGVLGSCLLITLGPLFLILGYITFHGITALDGSFFTNLPEDQPKGLAQALYGSAVLVGLSTLFAVPVGVFAAIFLAEYRTRWFGSAVRFIGELLAGVPSIIIGVFAYVLLVVPVRHFSGWAAVFALGLMMIPIVMRASEEALKLVPQSLRNASYALGAAQWQTVLRVTVPAALPAIITGVCLAMARIAGETAPLLFTANQSDFWPRSLGQDMPYLTYYIYTWSRTPSDEQNRVAWAAAFVLLAFVMLLNIGIRFLTGKRVVSATRAD